LAGDFGDSGYLPCALVDIGSGCGLVAWLGKHACANGFFFSLASVVTFGGAYAVLPYVAQQAVETHGWLSSAQMMSGLALAETTPGPLSWCCNSSASWVVGKIREL
jgi:hypothetical protein